MPLTVWLISGVTSRNLPIAGMQFFVPTAIDQVFTSEIQANKARAVGKFRSRVGTYWTGVDSLAFFWLKCEL